MYDKKNKTSIRELFESISYKYDFINNAISFGLHGKIKKHAVKNISHKNPIRILDLCTGTGDIAIELSKKYPEAEIIGIDFSEKMLEIAKKKTKNYSNITLKCLDITNLEIEPNSFDICFISFGLRNLPNVKENLNSMQKLLKKDGIISILDLGRAHITIRPLYSLYFNYIVPLIGKLFYKKIQPYLYLTKSLQSYPSQEKILLLLKECGFSNCKNINYTFGTIAQQIGNKK